jgi:chromosome segregation ATPase
MSDDSGTTKWMTYAELAQARGIDRHSVMRHVGRHRWRRQRGNDGRIRIEVPLSYLSSDKSDDQSHDQSPDLSSDLRRTISALSSAVDELREQLQREARRADAAEERAAEAHGRAAEVEARERALRTEMDQVRAQLVHVQVDLDTARQAEAADKAQIVALQAEVGERSAWSTLRRLRWAISGR